MTLVERIDRAVLFRAHAMDGIYYCLVTPDLDEGYRSFVMDEWAPRRWIRAGRVLNALLTRNAAA